ncbi:ABC transporter ATP-binding protein [Pusillimonas sp. ANT_WB101]|uniref:ABC transporter ATP-binding protein n=1 Tax=Pusillimonas sp. ANT_WB101 TaxID=2597356 RepID=UPI0011EBEE88|nr:ABC transporter ATP-binding protein [Pusillimonas sp. ANT_WB101]KAA0888456.1 ABC transporter ATP-binding protein [Pusillimonas sp. ANT_WB101]NYT76886.1 ABC transporter ATP-binding protein [Alcaligenaceae bacterium]
MKLNSIPITLENCSKTYHDTMVLQKTDLAIGAGETLVLLGPSGCGKTTTLRLIAGLERPDPGGRIMFGDEDVTHQPIETRRVGMVFQNYALFPNYSVRDNVGYGLKIQKVPQAERRKRVNELLEMVHLAEHADKQIDQLSGGQKQRVALARALAPKPRVLLLDEPLTALDAQLRETLRTDMDQLLKGLGVTTVYVTHDQAEAMVLGDRVVVMSKGRIEQAGSPREIYFKPRNHHVAQFIGSLNTLRGTYRDGVFVTAGGHLNCPAGADNLDTIFFRSEDAQVVPVEESSLSGTVANVQFLGERTRLFLDGVTEGQRVCVETSNRHEYQTGQQIGLRLEPHHLLLMAGES